MARQRWVVAGMLLVLAAVGAGVLLLRDLAGRTDETAEAKAVKAIKELGGSVTLDEHAPGRPVMGVDLSHTEVTDAGLKELKELEHLKELHLFNTNVTEAGKKELQSARPELRIVDP